MPDPNISASVGEDGTNRPADVRVIQRLLNKLGGMAALAVDGICGQKTTDRIHLVQQDFFGGSDGLIEPNGPTLKRLLRAIEVGFVQLPQVDPEDDDADYYSYSPARKQFGTPATIEMLAETAHEFHELRPDLRVGIGDISLRDGSPMPPHTSHRSGRNIDIRPLRKDGKRSPVTIHDPEYDREATRTLAQTLFAQPIVKRIFFNDTEIEGVKFFQGHHNHLHVETKE
ncbi:MAG: peptidoglycan-binding domain-containing protein [Blastocatellia bacterium]